MSAGADSANASQADRTSPVAATGLQARLDLALPSELAVGQGTALFVAGWCFCPDARISSLSFSVNGETQPVAAHGMLRRDVARAHGSAGDPSGADSSSSISDASEEILRSGFWGIARVPPMPPGAGTCELSLVAGLQGGGQAAAVLARIPLAGRPDPVKIAPADRSGGALVAVCMATYDPPLDLLTAQLDSIRRQTHPSWICIISDDCSTPERFADLQRAVAGDPRFIVSRSPRRLGFYRNFERVLSMVPPDVEYVALADQDDRWHDDKLDVLLSELGHAQLVYSDARIVDRSGGLISETYWSRRRNNHSSLLSVLVANSVTGAASLFPRTLLDHALPFPPAQFLHYHDHWLGLTALALGDIAFVERPLYDYVQHNEASLGHAAANRMTGLRDRLGSLRRDPRERLKLWRRHYFIDSCRLLQVATVLGLRCATAMTPAKRDVLSRFLRTERSLISLGNLAVRGGRELLGHGETLGAEWMLFHAFAWRRLVGIDARAGWPKRRYLDAVPPSEFIPKPDNAGLEGTVPGLVADKIAPLNLAPRDDAPQRINILVPTIDLKHFFGGYIAKFNLALRLAERGLRIRIVTVDPVGPLRHTWTREVEAYSGLAGLFDHVEIAFGRESPGLEISRSDRFIATTWWTAHIAQSALRSIGGDRFVYLIQEYEPFTFAMGSHAALADESYGYPHFGLFSSELLRDYFRRHALGVYAGGRAAGDAASASFQNAITAIDPPRADELANRSPRRLLFYARPEPHAARNMFELGVLALRRALKDGAFRSGWELNGIGTLESGRRLTLGDGAALRLIARSEQRAYGEILRAHDLGLALMYTPHPSLVPIEMASAGMLTVTNSFENKTPERMAEISGNLITARPTVEDIAATLGQAAENIEDVRRRARDSAVSWSRDWNHSFDGELLARLESFLA